MSCFRCRNVSVLFVVTLVSFFFLAGLSAALAQTLPDAGSLHRESERSLQAPQTDPKVIPPASRPMAEDDKAVRVTVQSVSITGATLIPTVELENLFQGIIGQSLTLAELEYAAQDVVKQYRKRGWFARVYLPQQDVTAGNIHIQVLESHYDGSRLEQQSDRASGPYVQNVVTHRLREGEPLSANNLERGLLLANDLPGVRASGLLEPGEAHSTSRLVVQVEDTPLVSGDLGVNSYGLKSTGRIQGVGGLALNDLMGIGDRLSVRALAASSIYSGALNYSLPLGHDGLRLATHGSFLEYKLRDRYKSLDAKGWAYTAGASLIYPLLRQLEHNLYLSTGYEYRQFDDDMLGSSLHRHRVNAFTLGLSGDVRDSFWGGAMTWGSAELTHGHLNIRDVNDDRTFDAVGPDTHGSYTKANFYLNRLQSVGFDGWQILFGLAGQVADGNLGSSERFSLGGPHRVRAYPVNEGNGDEGVFGKIELQKQLGTDWQAIAFYDVGYIRLHKNTWTGWDGGSGQDNSYSLSGVGLGLNWYGSEKLQGFSASVSGAVPVDTNRGRDEEGRNNDGSKATAARAWATLNWHF